MPGPWSRNGRCRTVPTELFFPTRGDDLGPALAICRNCAVRADCAEYAIPLSDLHGVWGGMSAQQRRQVRAARRRERDVQARYEPQSPVEHQAAPGTLLGTLADLSAQPGAWAIVVHYRSRNSAWSTASLLHTGKRPSPPGGSWEFEGRLTGDGGSDLWARFAPQPASATSELGGRARP